MFFSVVDEHFNIICWAFKKGGQENPPQRSYNAAEVCLFNLNTFRLPYLYLSKTDLQRNKN